MPIGPIGPETRTIGAFEVSVYEPGGGSGAPVAACRAYDPAVQLIPASLMDRIPGVSRFAIARFVLTAIPALAAATSLVWLLEQHLGVADASPVYLLPVVSLALVAGTVAAVVTAVGGILVYDYLFTRPILTLEIADPAEWVNLLLLLFVGLVVGQLAAIGRARALTAEAREREARELFLISRALATRASTATVLPEIASHLRRACSLTVVAITLGSSDSAERTTAVAAATAELDEPTTEGSAARSNETGRNLHWLLRRTPGDEPARWVRIHSPAIQVSRPSFNSPESAFRVRIEAAGRALGSIWAFREHGAGAPDRTATRLLSAAADQLGQAVERDHLAATASAAEVARQSDALKSALLQSVSHDLRTPLATIRAAAGTLRPDSELNEVERLASADAIDREVERLDRLVANLLDLGRIEAGALQAELDVFELDDVANRTIDRMAGRMPGRRFRVELPSLPVLVDPVFLDEALTNVLENAAKFAGPSAVIRVGARPIDGATVRMTVEDDGPGVEDGEHASLFDRFRRRPTRDGSVRPGTGLGLAVVRGLVDAMGGEVRAVASELGGLAIELDLPRTDVPIELARHSASAADEPADFVKAR